jgi:hypothetical protein
VLDNFPTVIEEPARDGSLVVEAVASVSVLVVVFVISAARQTGPKRQPTYAAKIRDEENPATENRSYFSGKLVRRVARLGGGVGDVCDRHVERVQQQEGRRDDPGCNNWHGK